MPHNPLSRRRPRGNPATRGERWRRCAAFVLAVGCVAPTYSEVVTSADHGFHIKIAAQVAVEPAAAYAQFLRISEWWDANHTWFGKAENLYLEATTGGCFCERSGDAAVQHLQVTHVQPNQRIVLIGGLGPLQEMGLHGALSFVFEPVTGGLTRITQEYRVTGYVDGGLKPWSKIVDQVQTIQMNGLVAALTPSTGQ